MSIFSSIRILKPKRNKFDLSHEKKLSLDLGKLVPILCQEVLPGDSFRVNTEVMLRFAPLLAPVMHRVNVYVHYFEVPLRLIWKESEDFLTGGKDGTLEPVVPTLGNKDDNMIPFMQKGTLWDYLGLPPLPPEVEDADDIEASNALTVSALPFRAYQLIYDEYYRDQNLSDPVGCSDSSGLQNSIPGEIEKLLTLRNRAWEKDYFTSALPWAQRGGEVKMPFSVDYKEQTEIYEGTGYDDVFANGDNFRTNAAGKLMLDHAEGTGFGQVRNIESIGANINDLRRSIKLQEWLEKNARGGARYIEQILAHFGVRSSDARLQRPQYLGGGRQPVVISEVLSTVETEDVPQANMAGHGVSIGGRNGFKRTFEEHGFVIGIMSVIPKTAYQNGVPRMFRRYDKFDYYWPSFANIGEQEIKQSEIFYDPRQQFSKDQTFGYAPRYAEYKYQPSTVHGDFRDNLAFWHMGRIFDKDAPPSLNEKFVMADPTKRIFAVQDPDVHPLWCQLYNRVDALRPMPYFGTPSF